MSNSFSSSVNSLSETFIYNFRFRVKINLLTKMSCGRMSRRKTIFRMKGRRTVALKMVRPLDVLCVVPKQPEDT